MTDRPSRYLWLAALAACAGIPGVPGSAWAEDAIATDPSDVMPETPAPMPWANGKIVGGKEAPGYVTFTFDDGPHLEATPAILDTLEEFAVPATFFVVGRHFAKSTETAKAGAKLLREMEDRGFTLGNHTTKHQHLPSLTAKAAKKAINGNAADLARVLGHPVHLFRPPFGATNVSIRRLLRSSGKTMVRWNIDSQDFRRANRKGIADRVLKDILAKNGGVVLLHDTKPWTAQMLPSLLSRLEDANCQRLESGDSPIIPVSLHYFIRDRDGTPRPIPAKVLKETQKAVDRLTIRCKTTIDKP